MSELIKVSHARAAEAIRGATAVAVALFIPLVAAASDLEKVIEPTREQLEFFEQKIRPILVERCYECHSEESGKQKGGLLLDSREGWMKGGDHGTAVVPSDPEKSLLIKTIRSKEDDVKMPPKEKTRLSAQQVADLEHWVQLGAPDPRSRIKQSKPSISRDASAFWSFQPVKDYPAPTPRDRAWPSNSIDNFILVKLEEKGLSHAPQADKRTLIRRAYFDLLGLPPTPERIDRFVQDKDPKAYEKLIDELLASEHYGERWGRHWLDVARYADSGGYETDIYYRNAWRYRDYVVKSFNEDKPYDRFVQEQIAGDELWPDDLALAGSYEIPAHKKQHLEARLATGLYTLGPQVHESNMDAPKLRYETLTDWVDTTGAAFMGLTLGCARCHDHKFDPLTQKDYYAMQAIFAGSKEVEIPLITGMGIADFKQHYPRILAVDEARKAYHFFEQRARGRELSDAEKKEKQRLLENIGTALLSVPEATAHDGPFVGVMEVPTATVLGHERLELTPAVYILNRGELNRPREKVEPDLPALLRDKSGWKQSLPGPFGSRKDLAKWLTDARHPLTARVMVNRIWQWHFGRGIVATPNDFGAMGERPSHLELLDWLASRFVQDRWSIKKLHRLIMLSSAYQMDSKFDPEENLRIDPLNTLVWRMNRQRLEAEELWDAIHAVAGTLNLKLGGRPVMPPLEADEMPPGSWIVSADPSEHNRRGIYVMVRRNYRFPMFDVFDSPVNAVSAPTRDTTTVAPQALYFLNNKTVLRQAAALASRLVQENSLGWNKPDFGPGHPGWEGAKAGKHAGWAKRIQTSKSSPSFDDPVNALITHGPTSLLVKIPATDKGGSSRIFGGLWNIRQLGRAGEWKLLRNDSELITIGQIDDSAGTSRAPMALSKGKNGAGPLEKLNLMPGDTLRLEILESDFVGVDLRVTTPQKIYDAAADFTLDANPTPEGWQYSESLANGGGTVGGAIRAAQREEGLAARVKRAWRLSLGRFPTTEEEKDSLELIRALVAEGSDSLPNMPEGLRALPPKEAAALTKFCLSLFNLNEFMYID